MTNSTRGGNGARNAPALAPTTYSDFTATHPPLFTEAGEPLEADHWLWVIESKFGLLRSTEVQKTLFTAQQLWGDASAWWANYTATHLRITRCRGLNSALPSAPTISPHA
jgi:hypothetical protein